MDMEEKGKINKRNRSYSKPRLKVLGKISELTQGGENGGAQDCTKPSLPGVELSC